MRNLTTRTCYLLQLLHSNQGYYEVVRNKEGVFMSKTNVLGTVRQNFILTRPYRLSELSTDEFDNSDFELKLKARKMQARRWRKIRRQQI